MVNPPLKPQPAKETSGNSSGKNNPEECRRCANHPSTAKCPINRNNTAVAAKNISGGYGTFHRYEKEESSGQEKCPEKCIPQTRTTPNPPPARGSKGRRSKELEEAEPVESSKEKAQRSKAKEKTLAGGSGKDQDNKKTQIRGGQTRGPTQEQAKCILRGDEGGYIPINQPFIFAMNPVTLKYKAILLDAAQLESVSQARFAKPRPSTTHPSKSHSRFTPRNVKVTSMVTAEPLPVDSAFAQLVSSNHPLLWVFGYPQDAEMEEYRQKCVQYLADKNSLYIINLDREIRRFNEAIVNRHSVSLNSGSGSGKKADAPGKDANLSDLILSRAKNLVRRVTADKQTLSTKEICELIKYSMLMAVSAGGHRSSQMQSQSVKGFILDSFPISATEGMDSEGFLYKSVVCLYFLNREWTASKQKEPKGVTPKYHLRSYPYSEKEVEAAADFFGFKTIKILNTEDLRDAQVEDIATLVKTHLEGRGLALHKIVNHDSKNPGDGLKNQGTNTKVAAAIISGSGMGAVTTNMVLNHADFVKAMNPDPDVKKTMGKKTAILVAVTQPPAPSQLGSRSSDPKTKSVAPTVVKSVSPTVVNGEGRSVAPTTTMTIATSEYESGSYTETGSRSGTTMTKLSTTVKGPKRSDGSGGH